MMNTAFRRGLRNGFLLVLAAAFLLIGCKDSGSIGSSFTENETSVAIDTLGVTNIATERSEAFTGNLSNLSAGIFDDPAFGEVKATGLIRPALSNNDSDNMQSDATLLMRLHLQPALVYGDTASTARFDLVEMTQLWRGSAWRINDEITFAAGAPLASFSVDNQEIVEIPITGDFVERYRDFFNSSSANRDSTYQIQFPGLAIVPQNSSKIITVSTDSTQFLIQNPDSDTLTVGVADNGYKLERSNVPEPSSEHSIVLSSLERVMSLDMSVDEDEIGSLNISKAELVFYQNTRRLENSLDQRSLTTIRPPVSDASFFLADPADLPFAVDPGLPISDQVEFDPSDDTFRFDVTSTVNSLLVDNPPPNQKFLIRLSNNNGVIRSSLLFTNDAPPEFQPKLIITSVQTNSTSN